MKLGYAIPRDIVIKPSANMGFIVKIGCGTFVAEGVRSLEHQLEHYFSDPEKWEKEYNELGNKCVCEDPVEVPPPLPPQRDRILVEEADRQE